MHRRTVVLSVVLAMFAILVPLPAAGATVPPSFYVSLGDSLAAGTQPDANGDNRTTTDGYADQLYKRTRGQLPGLEHIKLGCPGETTVTMVVGGICAYPNGSQLAEATAFLAAHPGEVAFITINLGANDVLACDPTDPAFLVCFVGVLGQIGANLPVTLGTLQAVAPGVPIFGMNYYNPNLAAWIDPGGPLGEQLAIDTTALTVVFNDVLESIYGHPVFNVPVADVESAFATTDFGARGKIPLNVFNICAYTWMCDPDRGPNIHANKHGYQVIAKTFEDLMRDQNVIPEAA